jgi:UDP-N-acetylglucosamine transferase subunit ALG13
MIFVTTGTQIPFDRFIRAVDEIMEWMDEPVIVQALKSDYQPRNFEMVDFIPPDEFNKIMTEARLIVGHAGMGSILSALEYEKAIIIFPRLASLGEHRNDHQMATAMKMNELGYVHVAYDQKQLKDLMLMNDLKPLKNIRGSSETRLTKSILGFVTAAKKCS